MALRLQAMGQRNYVKGFDLALHEDALELPLKWKKPQTIFVNSMSDMFHSGVPSEFIFRAFEVMRRASWHRFQVLTKRSERLMSLTAQLPWSENIWMGVSVESQAYTHRIEHLRQTASFIKFLSLEPLLGPLENLELDGIGWVIVGGESGPGARPMKPEWVTSIRDQCVGAKVPFFFKQWGGVRKKRFGRELDGRTWDQMPATSKTFSASRSAGQPHTRA
jgi:protein gp37